jgi:hypothetical protein
MSFTEQDKLKALAIVRIFETSEPLGEYDACAVLNDHAGVSYGINQFTHASGSLYDVVITYLGKGGIDGRTPLTDSLPILKDTSAKAVEVLSHNRNFKAALKRAGKTQEMREAQHEVAFRRYLQPAIEACEGSNFISPLSLAVIYDSINHGSYARIRDRVSVKPSQFMSAALFERAWIAEYVGARDHWLESVPRLKPTEYRTDFFLLQIARKNWDLNLPLNVHGYKLEATNSVFADAGTHEVRSEAVASEDPQASAPVPSIEAQHVIEGDNSNLSNTSALNPPAVAQSSNDQTNFSLGGYIKNVEAKFDSVNEIATGLARRTDAAKSMWTTIGGSVFHVLWAVIAFIVGLPRELWLVVAIIVGSLMLLYLYRQISLGKIREQAKFGFEAIAARL